jgi:glycerate kinase
MIDRSGLPIGAGGGELCHLARIDFGRRDQRLERVQIDAAVNWHNVLLGPRGVARAFGAQKGATAQQVVELEQGLEVYARCVREATGKDVRTQPGCGASGGLGSALWALLGATLHPRYEIVMHYVKLDELLDQADLVLTAEGCLDGQTPFGKIPAEVARRAKQRNLPVVALAGTIGKGVTDNFDHGIDAFASILKSPCSLQHAIDNAGKLLTRAADDAMRMMLVGAALGRRDASFCPSMRRRSAGIPPAANVGAS